MGFRRTCGFKVSVLTLFRSTVRGLPREIMVRGQAPFGGSRVRNVAGTLGRTKVSRVSLVAVARRCSLGFVTRGVVCNRFLRSKCPISEKAYVGLSSEGTLL